MDTQLSLVAVAVIPHQTLAQLWHSLATATATHMVD